MERFLCCYRITDMDLDHGPIRFLEICNQFEQIASMGIPFLAQHAHEAFRRTSKSLAQIYKANCPRARKSMLFLVTSTQFPAMITGIRFQSFH